MLSLRDAACAGRYGTRGDTLWVKETWRTAASLDAKTPTQIGDMSGDAGHRKPWGPIEYISDGLRVNWDAFRDAAPGKTRVSIHMPRWASRLTLRVVDVRAERLHDITDADCEAEGVRPSVDGNAKDWLPDETGWRRTYRQLWDELNGAKTPWSSNPWVWRIAFERVTEGAPQEPKP